MDGRKEGEGGQKPAVARKPVPPPKPRSLSFHVSRTTSGSSGNGGSGSSAWSVDASPPATGQPGAQRRATMSPAASFRSKHQSPHHVQPAQLAAVPPQLMSGGPLLYTSLDTGVRRSKKTAAKLSSSSSSSGRNRANGKDADDADAADDDGDGDDNINDINAPHPSLSLRLQGGGGGSGDELPLDESDELHLSERQQQGVVVGGGGRGGIQNASEVEDEAEGGARRTHASDGSHSMHAAEAAAQQPEEQAQPQQQHDGRQAVLSPMDHRVSTSSLSDMNPPPTPPPPPQFADAAHEAMPLPPVHVLSLDDRERITTIDDNDGDDDDGDDGDHDGDGDDDDAGGSSHVSMLQAIRAGVQLRQTQPREEQQQEDEEEQLRASQPTHVMDELAWRLRRRQRREEERIADAAGDAWRQRAHLFLRNLPQAQDVPPVSTLRQLLTDALEIEDSVGGRDAAKRLFPSWPHEYVDDLEAAITAYNTFISAHEALRETCHSSKPVTDAHLQGAIDRAVSAHAALFVRTNSVVYFACRRVHLDDSQREPCTHVLQETLRLALGRLWQRAEQVLASLHDPGLRTFDRRDRAAVCYRLHHTFMGYCRQFAQTLDMHDLLTSTEYSRAEENSFRLFEMHRDAIVVRERVGTWDKAEHVRLRGQQATSSTQAPPETEPQSLVHRVLSAIADHEPTQLRAALNDLREVSPARVQAKYQSFVQAAAGHNHLECLAVLLSWTHVPTRETLPARDMAWISAAVNKHNMPAVKMMLDHGLWINDINPNSHATALHMMAHLIRNGADIFIANRHSRTPLQVASNVFLPFAAPPPLPGQHGHIHSGQRYTSHTHHHHTSQQGDQPPSPTSAHHQHQHHQQHHHLDLVRYLETGVFSDVTLVADDGTAFQAHRIVLCAQSEYFRAMLESEWAEASQREISMPGLTPATLRIALHYLYSGHADYPLDDDELCLDLLETAFILLIEPMQRHLQVRLQQKLSIHNALEYYRTAVRLGSSMLVAHCCVFILNNYADLQDQDEGREVLYHLLEDLKPTDYQHNTTAIPRPYAI
ncbi:hypothetical protein PTSG_05304 [Salpingoeca rosetta]|uniref:BTB domain-containing protein n=1 Tax=Salpingoeca rosetta (strain ATCC 50818 / BSB-021) TaxID=946362 RepID=F2UA19_SALR5|nr:uncharacterized protein PTSG_05304 [Salpingoeca rosetta]EGD73594.1 hypothetical protein PTSG_05304 [Salpingoeca rosetta]|eukprot:XP_004993876.1 hypothetical protein PTSG_05304 [Salpingoeca rosetta]